MTWTYFGKVAVENSLNKSLKKYKHAKGDIRKIKIKTVNADGNRFMTYATMTDFVS